MTQRDWNKSFLIELNSKKLVDISKEVREHLGLKDGDIIRIRIEKVSKGKGVKT